MAWVKLDDRFPQHPKIVKAGHQAAWLYVAGLCYSAEYLTDGRIPKAALGQLTELRRPSTLAHRLIDVGLWADDGEDYTIHDFGDYNEPAEVVRTRREEDRQRKNGIRPDSRRNPRVPSSSRPVSRSSSSPTGVAPPDRVEEEDPRILETCTAIAECRVSQRTGQPIVNPAKYLASVLDDVVAQHADAAAKLAMEHPEWPAHRIAAELEDSLFANDPEVARQNALETARNFGAMRAGLIDADDIDAEFSRQFGDDSELCGAALAGWQNASDRLTEELRT